MQSQIVYMVIGFVLVGTQINAAVISRSEEIFELIILHNNDMHARFEQISIKGTKCPPEDVHSNKCYGGFARTAHEIRKFRKEAEEGGTPVIYLNAGDTYTGTPWFTLFKDNITAAFLNVLSPDAISLGNHEFDEGVEGLVPFLNKVNFPVLASNLNLSKSPALTETKSLKNSTVLIVDGTKIGVIGYLTPETKTLSFPNSVDYYPEIKSINAEAKKLKSEGVTIILALGHSGYKKDQEIAKNCPDVDIVIGGHTNTFLYNGAQPDAERPEGPYPTEVVQPNGKKVPVVQAYAYTKYLGKLNVKFNRNGDLLEWNGQPILLNSEIPRDSDILALLEFYRPNITQLETFVIGFSKVPLEGRSEICRSEECNLGNLVADSMVYARSLEVQSSNYWTDASIAFVQGGGIRSSIDKRPDGSITRNDILTVLPFNNDLYVVKVTGAIIRKSLERSASLIGKDSNGGFLQVSGMQVIYDVSKPEGDRLVSVKVLCAECDVPSYSDLIDNKNYNIIISSFLLSGGDGFEFIPLNDPKITTIKLEKNDVEAAVSYISDKSVVYPGIEGRVIIISKNGSIRFAGSLVSLIFAFLLSRLI